MSRALQHTTDAAAPPVRLHALAGAARQAAHGRSWAGVASVAVWTEPWSGAPSAVFAVEPGCTIADTIPEELAHEVVVCRYQGLWVLREHWQRPALPGDVIEWHVRPQGGGGGSNPLRTLLTLGIILASVVYGPTVGRFAANLFGATLSAGQAAALGTAIVQVGGSLALNAVLPMAQPDGGGASGPQASPSYNVALAGNAPRLEAAIPVGYGYNRQFPDFGGKPYSSFDNATSDQYYHALLVIGHGEYDVLRLDIDDTPLANFADVEYNVLGPGEAPTLVEPAVITAPEVTGQELMPGRYQGSYAAHGPELIASAVSFDVALPGLGVVNADGSISSKSVQVRFEARPVDYLGAPTGPWIVLATVDISAATADVVRRSYTYTYATAGRYVARAVRTSPKDEARNVLNSISWVGLRSTLVAPQPLEPSVTHLEIRIRASDQLNSLTERRIGVTWLRKLRTWTPSSPGSSTGTWSAPVATRNPAWALADAMTNAAYGDALPDTALDLPGLYALAQTWDARQDRCDLIIDNFSDSETIVQTIAATGRAVMVPRAGVRTIVRDQAAGLPVTAYSAGMMRPGSWQQEYGLPTSDAADGYIIEYWSNRAWDWLSIECPAPGRTYTDEAHPDYDAELPKMARPIRQRLIGITGATHAEREGRYMAAKLVYRRNVATWSTELQGVLPAFGKPVRLAPALQSWGRSGDVASWNSTTGALGLTEPHGITTGTHYITLQRDDGSWTGTITVTPGADERTVILAIAPDFELVTDAAWRERPKYILGTATQQDRIGRMVAIEPAGVDEEGTPIINMTAVIEDDRVHTADQTLLPGPGDVQDPINLDPVDPDEDGGTLLLTSLTDREVAASFIGSVTVSYALMSDGRVRLNSTIGGDAFVGSEWMLIAPTDITNTAQFEARATVISGTLSSGTVDTWQALDTTRVWALTNSTEGTEEVVRLDIEIRDTDTETVQSSCTVTLRASATESPGGA